MLENLLWALTICVAVSFYPYLFTVYGSLPDKIPTQFDFDGHPNKFLPKRVVFTFPVFITIILLILYYLPKYDKYSHNYTKFQVEYNMFCLAVICFFFNAFYHITKANAKKFNFTSQVLPSFGILLIVTGVAIQRSVMTQFFGVRNRWSMTSMNNWRKCNKLGAFVLYISGVVFILSSILSNSLLGIIGLFSLIGGLVVLTLYSYHEFKKEVPVENKKNN